MQTNNIEKTVIQKRCRTVCKYGCGKVRQRDLTEYKRRCHKLYRHILKQRLANLVDPEEFDDSHTENSHCTSWDIS